jgi:hypothetical protein
MTASRHPGADRCAGAFAGGIARRARRAMLFVSLIAAWIVAGCGEDVNFETAGDAGPPDAIAMAAPDAPADAPGAEAGDSASDDAGRDAACLVGDAAVACHPNGALCRSVKDCCSGRCEDGYCLKLGTCAAPGVPCSTRSTCCSGRCEPSGRDGATTCGQYCLADGAHCAGAADCCGFDCNDGICGGPLCSVIGTVCEHDSDCCSGRCDGGHCEAAFVTCLPTGEGCSADAGDGDPVMGPPEPGAPVGRCCSGFCETETGRCDLGPGSCREPSTPCDVPSDCCLGTCARNAAGVDVCTAPCLADGQGCNSNGDCCGGTCGGVQQQCMTALPACP